MAKLQSTLPNMLLSLTAICLVAGAVLAGVYEVVTGVIDYALEKQKENYKNA